MNKFESAESGVNNRRNFLKKAGVAAGAAWVAPTVLSQSAFAQGSGRPGSLTFTATGPATQQTVCGGSVTVTVVQPSPAIVTVAPSAGTTITSIVASGAPVSITGVPTVFPNSATVTQTGVATGPLSMVVTYTC